VDAEEARVVQVLQSRVLLRPRDFGRSLRFYEEELGLVRYREWGEAPHRGVVLFLGGGYLELTESGEGGTPQGVRLWLQVADLEAAVAELRSVGVTIDEPPDLKPWGLLEASLRDPDGLRLVLVETPVTHPLRRRQG
jgi:catechol 2,3-dioxygenase-like lactoylglutathione lyase family enzyme